MKKKFIIKQLNLAKNESEKRFSLKENYGIDFTNYENNYYDIFMNFMIDYFNSDDVKDDIEWWFWEDVKKEIWLEKKPKGMKYEIEKGNLHEYKINIKKTKDFYKYLKITYLK